ncbi:7712_t:CDS:2, partial [Gigaspora margarita]
FLAITLDNAANNGVFVRKLVIKLQEEANFEWNSEHLRFWCFNHILNLAAQAALDQIKDDVCKAFNTLTSSYNDLHHCAILRNQWVTFEKIVEFLEPFKDLTTKMSSSTYSTAFWFIPLFNIIINHVEDIASNTEIQTLSMAAMAAREKLVQYYSKTNTTMMLYTALDLEGNLTILLKRSFQMTKLVEQRLYEDFDDNDEVLDEIKRYISERPVNKDVDVLAWWKFSRLSNMARDYLAIPASFVASERSFSA